MNKGEKGHSGTCFKAIRYKQAGLPNIILSVACCLLFSVFMPDALVAQEDLWINEVSHFYYLQTIPIPQQVLLSQRIGVGKIQTFNKGFAHIEVICPWVGAVDGGSFPVTGNMGPIERVPTNASAIYFATTNLWWRQGSSGPFTTNLFAWATSTNHVLGNAAITTTNWTAVNDSYWFIPLTNDMDSLVHFTSNLVHAAWKERDENLYNSIVGSAATNAWMSEVARHARGYVICNMSYLPTNIVNEALTRRDE